MSSNQDDNPRDCAPPSLGEIQSPQREFTMTPNFPLSGILSDLRDSRKYMEAKKKSSEETSACGQMCESLTTRLEQFNGRLKSTGDHTS